MYEMIMDLPLFKGVSKGQVSQFLEKTNVDFLNYESGETIIEEGDEVTMVKFVVSGAIRITYALGTLPMEIIETCRAGSVLGADRLYGISTDYPYKGVAIEKTSIMQFSKEQYVNLLLADRIYMINFFNFLSLRAQRPIEMMKAYPSGDLRSRLSLLLSVITQPGSSDIEIKASDETLAKFANITKEEAQAWKDKSTRRGLIRCADGSIKILSRKVFLS